MQGAMCCCIVLFVSTEQNNACRHHNCRQRLLPQRSRGDDPLLLPNRSPNAAAAGSSPHSCAQHPRQAEARLGRASTRLRMKRLLRARRSKAAPTPWIALSESEAVAPVRGRGTAAGAGAASCGSG